MPTKRNIGPSIAKLELANNSATEHNPEYISAKKEYDKIIENASNFINTHAPVMQICLSKNAYKNGVDIYNPDAPENEFYLSASPVLDYQGLYCNVYISTHTITPMLRFILFTEGWSNYDGTKYYYINLTRNGNLCRH